MGRYDKDIEENPYLGEHSKFTMQFARDHGITMEEAYKHPVVKAHKEDLRHLTECYKFANGNMRLNYYSNVLIGMERMNYVIEYIVNHRNDDTTQNE